MIKKKVNKKLIIAGAIVILIIIAIFVGINYYFSEKESFSTNPTSIKLNLLLQEETAKIIKITNHETTDQTFNLYFDNLKDLASLKEEEFVLSPKESKEIKIYFKDTKNKVEAYAGRLVIETDSLTKRIPIIVVVKDKNRIFTVNHDSLLEHNNPYSGGQLGVEVKLFDMDGDNLREIKLEHFIKNFDNELILLEEEDRTITGSLLIRKVIDIPETWPKEDYVFFTLVEYKGIKSVSGLLFTVSEEKKSGLFSEDLRFFVIIITVFVIGGLTLFFYFLKTRDELLVQLKKQQDRELKRNLEFVKHYKSRIKLPKKVKKLEKIKKKIIKRIKVKQKIQRKELKRLKRKGKKNQMRGKLNLWKKQGYKMFKTKKEMNKFSKNHMKKQMGKWKKEGYNFVF